MTRRLSSARASAPSSHKIGFLRYDYSLNAAFDVGNYTGIGFTANMSTGDGGEDENMIDKLSGIMDEMKEFAQKPDGITSTGGSMDSLSEIYREVMSNADDTWTEILNVKLFENNGNALPAHFLLAGQGQLIVSANLAVSLGVSFDYTTQKRYNFSVRVKSQQTTTRPSTLSHRSITSISTSWALSAYERVCGWKCMSACSR